MAATTAALVAAAMVSLSVTPLPPFAGEFVADAALATTSAAAFRAASMAAALASKAGCDGSDAGGGVVLEEDTGVGAALAVAGSLLASAAALLVGFGSGALAFAALPVVGATEEDDTSDVATLLGCPSAFCFFCGGSKVADDDVTAAGATDCLAGATGCVGAGFGVGGGRAVP